MISRHWKGIVKVDMADAYLNHLQKETFSRLNRLAGFHSASVLKRSVTGGYEFVVITQWDSLAAISQFAGTDIGKAVVPPIVQQMMIEFDDRVVHYEVKMEFCGSNR